MAFFDDLPEQDYSFVNPQPKVTAEESRPAWAVANDLVIEGANAAVGGVKTIVDFAAPGSAPSRAMGDFIERGESMQSDVTKAAKEKFRTELEEAGGFTEEAMAAGRYIWENPGLAAAYVAGNFAPVFGAVKGASGVAQGISAARGAKQGLSAAQIAANSAQAGTRAGVAAGSAMGASMSGGDAAGQVYDDLTNPQRRGAVLASPEAQALIAQGMSEDEAIHEVAIAQARKASVAPAAIGGVFGAFGLERALAGGAGRGRAVTGLIEGLQGATEETATGVSAGMAGQAIDPSIDPMKGAGANAALGFVYEGVPGVILGGRREDETPAGPLTRAADTALGAQAGAEAAATRLLPAPPAQPAEWDVVNDRPQLPGGAARLALGYEPEAVEPTIMVDSRGNAARAPDEWVRQADAQRAADEEMGLTPDVRAAQARRAQGEADGAGEDLGGAAAGVSPAGDLAARNGGTGEALRAPEPGRVGVVAPGVEGSDAAGGVAVRGQPEPDDALSPGNVTTYPQGQTGNVTTPDESIDARIDAAGRDWWAGMEPAARSDALKAAGVTGYSEKSPWARISKRNRARLNGVRLQAEGLARAESQQAGIIEPEKPARTREQASAERKRAYREANPFRSFLAEHGINVADRSDTGAERNRPVMVPFHGPLYRRNGLRLDELARRAVEAGFLTQADIDSDLDNGGVNKLADMIRRDLAGERILPVTATESEQEAQWRAEMDARYEAMQEAEEAIAALTDDEINALLQLASDEDAELRNEEIDLALEPGEAQEGGGSTQKTAAGAEASGDPRGGAEARDESPGEVDGFLTAPTPEGLRAKADAEERARGEQTRRAVAPPAEDFTLTGSNRPADEAAARGQQEIAPTEPAEQQEPSEPEGAAEAMRKYGFEAVGWNRGKGLNKNKWSAAADGILSNYYDTAEEAVAELREWTDRRARGRENEARQREIAQTAADKIRRGEQPTDAEWGAIFPGWREGHRYVRQPAASWFLTEFLGVPKHNIRANIGAAAGTLTSDAGAKYPIVYPKRLAEVFGSATETRDGQPVGRDGLTDDERASNRLDGIADDLARQIDVESSERDFAPSEIPAVIEQWAKDNKVDAGELRTRVVDLLRKRLSEGRMRQVEQALSGATKRAPSVAANRKPDIADFGEKIEGARKDVWASFRDKMQQAGAVDIAAEPLSKSWPAPDYQALLDEGADSWAIAFMHAARDAIPTKPQKAWKVKEWVKSVRLLRDVSMGLADGRIDRARAQELLAEAEKTSRGLSDIAGRIELYQLVGHSKSLAGVRVTRGEYSMHNRIAYNPPKIIWTVEKQAAATAFSNWPRELASGETKEQALANFKEKFDSLEIGTPAKKETTFEVYSKRGENGYWVGKKIGRNPILLEGPFETVKEARTYKDSHNTELTEKLERSKEVPSERRDTNRPRVGEDMRGGADVTPQMFEDAFGFKGVQFGNYVEQGRRQKDLNDAYDALMDMAAILGVPPKALSLNGELGLAFGARGKGGKGAATAHYEHEQVVINLTKREGAGSLGHEWWHALDNYFSRMRSDPSGYMTEGSDVSLAAKGSDFVRPTAVRREMVLAFGEVLKAIRSTAIKARASKLDAKRTKAYWTTSPEMSARAFESFLISKLQDQGASNDYLANIVDEATWAAAEKLGFELEGSYPYPTAGEVPVIRAAFEHFFQTVETRETDRGTALFSRGEPTGTGMYMPAVESIAKRVRAGWKNGPEVIVAATITDPKVPQAVREAAEGKMSAGLDFEAEGFFYEGKVYLVADALDSEADVVRVLLHESAGHYGLRGLFGDRLDSILQQIVRAKPKAVADKMAEYGLTGAEGRLLAAEEVLARLAETNPKMGFVRRAIAAIRSWLREIGFDLRLSDSEIIRDVIIPARRFVESGAPAAAGGTAMSRAPGSFWTSPLEQSIASINARAQPARQWLAQINALTTKGVKADEIEWSGIREWLELQDGRVTKEAVLDYLSENGVRVEETMLGERAPWRQRLDMLETRGVRNLSDGEREELSALRERFDSEGSDATPESKQTKFDSYRVPGGENYRELLLTLPPTKIDVPQWKVIRPDGHVDSTYVSEASARIQAERRGAGYLVRKDASTQVDGGFRSSHWDQPNVLAHIRFDERTDADGKRVLFINEIQSDWGQKGKKHGFKTADRLIDGRDYDWWSRETDRLMSEKPFDREAVMRAAENRNALAGKPDEVPRAAFVTKTEAWVGLALKRAIRYAVDNGFDRVAIVSGDQASDLFDLSNQVDRIYYERDAERFILSADARGGGEIFTDKRRFTKDELEGVVGKEIAQKIIDGEGRFDEDSGSRVLEGIDLKVGGAGMRTFYDKIVPNVARDVLKRLGGDRPLTVDLPGTGEQVGFDITPKMREQARAGVPLFSRRQQLSDNIADLFASSKGFNWWHRTIGTQYEKAQRNEHFKRVFDTAQEFLNDVSDFGNRAADAAPSLLPKLDGIRDAFKKPPTKRDLGAIARPIFDGTLMDADPHKGRVWTDAELREKYGLNDRQIGLYREFRAAVDRSLDDMGKTDLLRYAGKDASGVRDRVLAAPSVGEAARILSAHLAAAAQADPKRADALNDTAATVLEKADSIEGLKRGGYAPLMRFGRFSVYVTREGKGEPEQLYFGMFETQREANIAARRLRAEFPDATVQQGVMSQEAFKLFQGVNPDTLEIFADVAGIEKTEAFQQYLKLARANRSAMKRLIHRKGTAGFSEDVTRVLASFITSNARAGSMNLHTGELNEAVAAIPKEQGDVRDEGKKLAEFARGTNDPSSKLRGLLFMQFLGGSVASALVNMTQPITMTYPYLARFVGAGRAGTMLTKAMRDAVTGVGSDADLAAALKRAEREGIVSPQEIHHLYAEGGVGLSRNPLVRRATLVWGSFFSAAEQFNRRASFIAAYRIARAQKEANPYAFATHAVEETQGIYSRANRPNWSRNPVGATVLTFKQFSIHYVEFLKRLPPAQQALALVVLALAAGLEELPFADDVDDAVDTIAHALGYNWSSKRAKREWLAKTIGADASEFVLKGAQAIPGFPLGLSARLGLGNLVPGTGMLLGSTRDRSREITEVVGVAGSFAQTAIDAAGKALAGDAAGAAQEVMPLAVKNVLKGLDMYQTGMYRDSRGRRVMDVGGYESLVKAIGFQPAGVSAAQDRTSIAQQQAAHVRNVQQQFSERMALARFERDDDALRATREDLREWNRKNPEARIQVSEASINRRLRAMRATRAERIEKAAPRAIRAALDL